MNFAELRKLDVSRYVEKKNGLSYLSWAWAVDQLLLADPTATWEYRWVNDAPFARIGETCMVFCTVTMGGISRTAQLPVMDHRNKAIQNPDAFQVNTAMQRCLAKAIALHGIGLYIYNGEDLPPDAAESHQDDAGDDAERPDDHAHIRAIADACIALHAAAVVKADRDSDMSGFWELYEKAKDVQGDERMVLWGMLKMHPAVRAALKEYRALEDAMNAKKAA